MRSVCWVLLILILGCRNGLSTAEIEEMAGRKTVWSQVLEGQEEELGRIALRHSRFITRLQDSSRAGEKSILASDSLLRARVMQLDEKFGELMLRHLVVVKTLRMSLQEIGVWIVRVNEEGCSPKLARRSWLARMADYRRLSEAVAESEKAFQQLEPLYQKIRASLPYPALP
jgi:hypothetical protein